MNGPKITCYQCDIEIPEKLFPRHVKRVHEREDTNKGIFLDQVFEHFWTHFEKTKTLLSLLRKMKKYVQQRTTSFTVHTGLSMKKNG